MVFFFIIIAIFTWGYNSNIANAANSYYVSMSGSDSNDGSNTRPWATLSYALGVAEPGDTIYVRAGTYPEGEINIPKSGLPGSPITIRNYPGERPILFHTTVRFNGKSYIAWQGFEIDGNEAEDSGDYNNEVTFEFELVASGIYLYSLIFDKKIVKSRKMIMLK